jgi:hypothetical protein
VGHDRHWPVDVGAHPGPSTKSKLSAQTDPADEYPDGKDGVCLIRLLYSTGKHAGPVSQDLEVESQLV